MRNPFHVAVARVLVAALFVLGPFGCSSGARKGGAIGAVAGGAAGAVIGHATGHTVRGTIIGAAVGGAAGAIIGHEMDKQADELKQEIPGATVTRVGEGIAVTFASGLLFDFDSDVVKAEARRNLNALADNLDKYKQRDLLIVGHADAIGSSAYNQDLSERRAISVERYLRAQGVMSAMEAVGRGEDEPIASNETEEGRAQNRRVEIAIYASDDLKEAAKREVATR